MAKKEQEQFVTHIARRDENFAQWYTDVVRKTELVEYSEVKGFMVIRPYGYGIWELMQAEMDRRIKETGHKNAYFPLLIPEHLLQKEVDHIEGFAPEVAWVTQGGTEKLNEKLAIRPTSETIICSMFSKWVQSHRDLPLLINQWCNVVRWEKSTRPFLRTAEFLWQEGHTVHATPEEAEEETVKMLEVYRDFMQNVLAIPVICGQKSEKEKFAGAHHTYTVEAMMQDGKALQMGTSHNLAQHFAQVYDIQFLDKDGARKYGYSTSWGTTTRMIGGMIMAHGDDRGLAIPPRVAPIQVVIVPIAMHKEGVLDKAEALFREMKDAGLRVELDDRENQSPGWKFNEWEMKGVPARIEIGPRDIENGVVTIVRRDTLEKSTAPIERIAAHMANLMEEIHANMFAKAKTLLDSRITDVHNADELKEATKSGFARGMWCGEEECEASIKADMGVTTRCIPFDAETTGDICCHCGKPAKHVMYFAKAY